MKDIKFKIFASALASVLLVGCNDLDTEPLGAVITSDQKEEVVKNDPEMVSASVTGITAMFSVYGARQIYYGVRCTTRSILLME